MGNRRSKRSTGGQSPWKKRRDAAWRRQKTPPYMEADRPLGDCADCGKKCFASRGAAERHGRRLYPGRRMRIYACGQWWHLTSQDAATISHK